MIGYLKGRILDYSEGKMLLAVGESESCVGYSLTMPQNAASVGFVPAKSLELFIYTHVREDALDLYGFVTRFEKDLFLALLSVNGVGPKAALGILSGIEPGSLVDAILNADVERLCEIPGIGKKTAERVVVELKDSIRKKAGLLAQNAAAAAASGAASTVSIQKEARSAMRDARDALLSLGYRENEVIAALKQIESMDAGAKAEDMVRSALKQLA